MDFKFKTSKTGDTTGTQTDPHPLGHGVGENFVRQQTGAPNVEMPGRTIKTDVKNILQRLPEADRDAIHELIIRRKLETCDDLVNLYDKSSEARDEEIKRLQFEAGVICFLEKMLRITRG